MLKKKSFIDAFVSLLLVAVLLSGCNSLPDEMSQTAMDATDCTAPSPSEKGTESTSESLNTPTAPSPISENVIDIEKVEACITNVPNANISIPVIMHRQEGDQIVANVAVWDVANGGFTAGQECYSYNANLPLFVTCWDGEKHFWGTDKQTVITNKSYTYTDTTTIPYGGCYYFEGKLWYVNSDGSTKELPMPAAPELLYYAADALQERPLYANYNGDEIVLVYHSMISLEQYGLAYCRYKPEAVKEVQWEYLTLLCEAYYPFVNADVMYCGDILYIPLYECMLALDIAQGTIGRLTDIDRLITSHGEQTPRESGGYIDIVGCYEDVMIVYVGPLITGEVTHSYFCAIRQGCLIGSVCLNMGLNEESADGTAYKVWNFYDAALQNRLASQSVAKSQILLLRFPCTG